MDISHLTDQELDRSFYLEGLIIRALGSDALSNEDKFLIASWLGEQRII